MRITQRCHEPTPVRERNRLTPAPSRTRLGAGLALFASIALLVSMTGCAGSGVGSRGVLRIGVSPDYPPVIFEQDGQIVGIEADLARAVCEKIGRRPEFRRYALSELIDALERGEVDVVMSGLSITPERAQRVSFTSAYMEVGQLALIRARDVGRFGRVQGMRQLDARVGYERMTTGEEFVARHLIRASAFGFESVPDGIRSLRAGRIDYFIHDAPTIWRLAGDPAHRDLLALYRPLTQEGLAWAVRKEDAALRATLNATLMHWRREGMIEPILSRWIPVRVNMP